MKSVHHLTSVFNIPEIEDEELDYRKLYEKEKKLRAYYQRKSRELQGKLRTLAKDNKHTFGRNKLQGIQEILQDIKSFKCMLPNSIKEIPVVDSDAFIENVSTPTLLKEWAIYGISEEDLLQVNEWEKYEGSAVISNSNPSQILQHTSRLVFPSGTSARILSGKQASEYSLQIINLSKQKLKSFILSFQPTFTNKKEPEQQNQKDKKQLQIINQLNPERRVYAICIQVQQFTVLEGQNKMIELKTPKKLSSKGQKTVKFKSAIVQNTVQQFKIVVSKRVYCLFSYYPFFSFYEQLLRSLFYAIKVQRYIRYKEGGSNLKAVDSKFHTSLVKDVLSHLKKESTNKAIVLDQLLDFQLCGNNKVYLQLNIDSLTFLVAEEWAYYILSLFTLDVFLDLLTLLMLEQKMVFVCDNATILTYAIFLFTKVLIRPFQYPYPVVNIIPDQQQYLNAPFPVVYGYLKKKEEIIEAKIPKRYKNVYVIFQPTGIQILSEQCKKKLLSKKSPRLRDRLISKFKKMQRNFPTTNFFSFMQKKNEEFQYPVNKTLAREILSEVHNYIQNDIFRLLPNQVEIGTIKTFLATTKHLDEDDMNQQVFLKIKEDYSQKSKDPFFSAFLDTQLLNVHIFKY